MAVYKITPSDVLFFRDARPFETGGGHGARWPEPGVIFSAFHAALHRAYPDQTEEWEHKHRHGRSGKYDNDRRDKRFGSLQTAGPFPVMNNACYFSCPQDVTAIEKGEICRLTPLHDKYGKSNLPGVLSYQLGGTAKPEKENKAPAWWSKADVEEYLRGGDVLSGGKENCDFFDSEWTTGIGIDPHTQAQDGKTIYSAEYLRLRPDVRMGVTASMPLKNGIGDGLNHLFSQNKAIVVGGQQRVCKVEQAESPDLAGFLPVGQAVSGERVKWLLLSPAVFPEIKDHAGGWLPSWVNHATGTVELMDGVGKNKARRKKMPEGKRLNVKLVAARIPKPIIISGWSERLHLYDNGKNRGPKKTELAVPAGAVYYFEGPDASRLADRLNWHGEQNKNVSEILNRRSSIYGEQGFGIGVCGSWNFNENQTREVSR